MARRARRRRAQLFLGIGRRQIKPPVFLRYQPPPRRRQYPEGRIWPMLVNNPSNLAL